MVSKSVVAGRKRIKLKQNWLTLVSLHPQILNFPSGFSRVKENFSEAVSEQPLRKHLPEMSANTKTIFKEVTYLKLFSGCFHNVLLIAQVNYQAWGIEEKYCFIFVYRL